MKFEEVMNEGKVVEKTREDMLMEILSDEINAIESGDIYEHGYPEGRLVPSNHFDLSEQEFIDNVSCEFAEEVSELLREICKLNRVRNGI